ncbi:MAG: FtsL-like putative cell division protein [Leeuwenhoekiella sp.]
MKKGIYHILKGQFLVSNDAVKNWRMILFLSILAIVMIASSHQADRKVMEIARLNLEVKELASEFKSNRLRVRRMEMESAVTRKVLERGLKPPLTPPNKIIVKSAKD